jgi:ADP-ribose pyrophosphatase
MNMLAFHFIGCFSFYSLLLVIMTIRKRKCKTKESRNQRSLMGYLLKYLLEYQISSNTTPGISDIPEEMLYTQTMNFPRPPSKQPIPPEAKKVFSGVMFDVYQWQQAMFDGTFETFEKIKRVDTVGVLAITDDHKIHINRQEQPGQPPFLGCFGGRIDPGEDPLDAAKRELLEEAGFEARNWKLWFAFQPLEKIDWAIYTFIAQGCSKVADQHLDAGEKIETISASLDEFIGITQQEQFRDQEITWQVLRMLQQPQGKENLESLLFS